jgi:hypothetical protein
LPVLVAFLVIDGLGECAGYLFGGGKARERLKDLEFSRERYVTTSDRQGNGSV